MEIGLYQADDTKLVSKIYKIGRGNVNALVDCYGITIIERVHTYRLYPLLYKIYAMVKITMIYFVEHHKKNNVDS